MRLPRALNVQNLHATIKRIDNQCAFYLLSKTVKAVCDSAEAFLVTSKGTYSEGYTTLCAGYPDADSLRHACIAIFGSQLFGKSTLLDDLFETSFKMLDEDDGQQQTTKGIIVGVIPGTESSPTILLLNCEESESGERVAAADQKLEIAWELSPLSPPTSSSSTSYKRT